LIKQKSNILIVDDDEPFCESLKDVIENSGYAVKIALCGVEALDMYKKDKFELVIVDIRLPDMAGNYVVDEMFNICPSTEYIYITGNACIDSAIEAVRQARVLSYEAKPLNIDGILRTINQSIETRQMEKRCKEAELEIRKLSRVVEQSPVTVMITNIEGSVVYVNAKFMQLTGYTREDIIGKNPSILQSGKTSPEVYNDLWKTITSGQEWRGELCNMKKNGEDYLESACISAMIDENGKINHYIAVKEDITDKRRMEEALMQSEKLKSMGIITAGISHEFNNILAIISGNIQLLENTYKDDSVLTKALCTIMKAADDGAEISSNMLKFAKASHNTKELRPSDIRVMLMQSIDFTKPRWANEAQAGGIEYKMDTEGMKRVPSIMCKPSEMREIFINLINNALDAMPGGGIISFSTWSDNDTVFVNVTDNGEGMAVGVKKNIFDPFYSTKGVAGTGLGMSMVYGVVDRHGGKIEVESGLGKGSTFALQFPITNKEVSSTVTPEPEQETDVKNLRILVVDDQKAICDIHDQFLTSAGHKVKTVDNGADAINIVKAEEFDLVLCDLAMPDVYGIDVIKTINGLEKKPKIGIITGGNAEPENMSAEEFQVDFLLMKPFKHPELLKHINDLFGADFR